MLRQAEEYLKQIQARKVEAYPETGSIAGQNFKTWNTFCGFESDFIESGFKRQQTIDAYSVLSKDLKS